MMMLRVSHTHDAIGSMVDRTVFLLSKAFVEVAM